MDPNETLNRIRQQADALLHPRGLQVSRDELAAMLAENVEALDEWLSRGGFPPEAWREGPDAFGEENPVHDADNCPQCRRVIDYLSGPDGD